MAFHIDQSWLSAALHAYGLDHATTRRIPAGDDNATYYVTAKDADVVLRIYGVTKLHEISFEVDLIGHLVEHGFPTPAVHRCLNGESVFTGPGVAAVLFDRARGMTAPSGILGAHMASGAAAQLHDLTRSWESPVERTRTDLHALRAFVQLVGTDSRFGSKPGAPKLADDFSHLIREASPVFARLPRAAIHHDLHPDNLLVSADGELAAVLDFDEAYLGPRVIDLAAIVHAWSMTAGRFDSQQTDMVLTTYLQSEQLTPAELSALPVAMTVFQGADAANYLMRGYRRDPDISFAQSYSLQAYRWLRSVDGHDFLRTRT